MKYYAYVRNSFYSRYCIEREKCGEIYNRDIFMKDFLETVGTPTIISELQDYYKEFDMLWCYVEIKEGWSVKLVLYEKYGSFLDLL